MEIRTRRGRGLCPRDVRGGYRSYADWSPLAARANLTFFADAFDTEDEAAAVLADFEILLTMRERTACSPRAAR
jgi:hypothetical protein